MEISRIQISINLKKPKLKLGFLKKASGNLPGIFVCANTVLRMCVVDDTVTECVRVYTVYCILYTVYCILYTIYGNTVCSILYTVYCIRTSRCYGEGDGARGQGREMRETSAHAHTHTHMQGIVGEAWC